MNAADAMAVDCDDPSRFLVSCGAMMKKRVFVGRRIPQSAIDRLIANCDVEIWPDELPPPRDILLQKVSGCDGILSMLSDRMDGELMDVAGPQLKVISNYAVGYNNIDVAAATKRGIQVGNTPGVLSEATADIGVALVLATARRIPEGIDEVRQLKWKTWSPTAMLGLDLLGKTVGVVGMGRIGLAFARRLHFGWQMKVVYTSRSPKPDVESELSAQRLELGQLLDQSDIVSLHADYNPTTHHLINASTLQRMKPSAILINTARGGLVDQEALFDALNQGTIWGAGLDVTDPEPLPDVSPLRTLPRCVILPHIGSSTYQTRQAMADIAVDNVLAGLSGQPLPHRVS